MNIIMGIAMLVIDTTLVRLRKIDSKVNLKNRNVNEFSRSCSLLLEKDI